MTTATIQKNYKKLEYRLDNLERLLKVVLQDELTVQKIKNLEKISTSLDRGNGKRFSSHREFSRYLKTL